MRPATAIGAVLLLLALPGWWAERPLFYACWLSAWWFCGGLVLGAGAIRRIHVLTGGAWGRALAPALADLQRPWLPWLLLFVPLAFGVDVIYPWAADRGAWLATMKAPGFVSHWFTPGFVAARLAAYALAAWWLARGDRSDRPGRAALGLMAYMLLYSGAAVDLLMALVAGWTSSVFGWLALVGQMATAAAAAVALASMRGDTRRVHGKETPVSRDLGNLLLMFVMLQAYLQFMQLLIIWAENLPREIGWYLPRFRGGWADVGVVLIVLQFFVPFILLLWRRVKDEPLRLAAVAAGFFGVQALGTGWLAVPSVQATGLGAWWLLPATMGGMVLLLYGHLLPGWQTLEAVDGRS